MVWSNDYPINTLQTFKDTDTQEAKERLQSFSAAWGIINHQSAMSTLSDLVEIGHRSLWPEVKATLEPIIMSSLNHPESSWVDHLAPSKVSMTSRGTTFAYNLLDSIPELLEKRYIDQPLDLLKIDPAAWDYGRVVFVARTCFQAGYINENQAWEFINKSFEQVQSIYRDWREFSNAYFIGRYMWGGPESANSQLMSVHKAMLNSDNSLWNVFPLNSQKHQKDNELAPLNEKSTLSEQSKSAPLENAPNNQNDQKNQDAHVPEPKGWLKSVLSIPLIGPIVSFIIGVVPPFVVAVASNILLKNLAAEDLNSLYAQGSIALTRYIVLIFIGLSIIWCLYLSRKKGITPLFPFILRIPLIWLLIPFWVIKFMIDVLRL